MQAVRDRRPLPIQVRDEIRELISGEGLALGDQLPTELELGERFDVARTTVREALKLLEQDGLVSVQHGRGHFVTAPPSLQRPITRLESVTEMMDGLGYKIRSRVLSVEERPAKPEEATALQIVAGFPVIRLERVRLQGHEPLIYSVDVLPRELIRLPLSSIDWAGSLLALLAAEGFAFASSHAELTAVGLPPSVARAIGRDPSEPWLLMVQVHLTGKGQPVLYSHDYHRGDVFTFHVARRRHG